MARLREPEPVVVDGVPAELDDPAADVWRDEVAYLEYMDVNDYTLSIRERIGLVRGVRYIASPEERRRAAHEGWAGQDRLRQVGL